MLVDRLRSNPLAGSGDGVNALWIVVGFIAVPAVMLSAYDRGAFRSTAREYSEDGFVRIAVSRTLPAVVPATIAIAFLVLLSPRVPAAFGAAAVLVGGGVPPLFLAVGVALFAPILIYPALPGHLVIRFVVDRRIARLMASRREVAAPGPDAGPKGMRSGVRPRGSASPHGSPSRAPSYARPPERCRWTRADIRSWREYGPVHRVASPRTVPLLGYLDLTLIRSPEAHFAATSSSSMPGGSPRSGRACAGRSTTSCVPCPRTATWCSPTRRPTCACSRR